ncbi:hypothetical protein N7509_000008 [Penicillium cosmopolitanum]|uniref:Uncharacterized protein n=1 Tax=Penicillium cosmopolitanum TaxID=1131564 RepID=A0A9W9WCC8_9EURO|nr:uncharacterized protein N7509_006537 [Penicillium cosmopolitanum]XP_056494756.1 uncharacterized protein N7509_000008 [Penicillium cosmopolitanum]KAJ5394750.1 hypothetical protein N7509_006537 [Penicillium cosmopolitanum]KAJ5414910.1 hypothetical protein N7509_000008 [Penicillium cosmopolitanum]
MACDRLIECKGDKSSYIKHLELRIIELDNAYSPSSPEAQRPCTVCQNPSHYIQGVETQVSADDFDHQQRIPESSLQIFFYEPRNKCELPVTAGTPLPTKATTRELHRLSSFASFISILPESDDWKRWTAISELNRKEIVHQLVSGPTLPDHTFLSTSALTTPELSILLDYSKCIPREEMDTTALACFQELIFCSMCAVALEVAPKEHVFQAMRSIFRSHATEKSLRGRIRGAKWANRVIDILSGTTWGLCSWDIIYNVKHRVNFFSQFNDYSIDPYDLKAKLKKRFYPKDQQVITIPFAIPSIIRTIYRNRISTTSKLFIFPQLIFKVDHLETPNESIRTVSNSPLSLTIDGASQEHSPSSPMECSPGTTNNEETMDCMVSDKTCPLESNVCQQNVICDSEQFLDRELSYVPTSGHHSSPVSQHQDRELESYNFTPTTLQSLPGNQHDGSDHILPPTDPDRWTTPSLVWDVPGNLNPLQHEPLPSSLWDQVWSWRDDGNDSMQLGNYSDPPQLTTSAQFIPPQGNLNPLQHEPLPSSLWDQVWSWRDDGNDSMQLGNYSDPPQLTTSARFIPPQGNLNPLQHEPSPSNLWDQVFGFTNDRNDGIRQHGSPSIDPIFSFSLDVLQSSPRLPRSTDSGELWNMQSQSHPNLRQRGTPSSSLWGQVWRWTNGESDSIGQHENYNQPLLATSSQADGHMLQGNFDPIPPTDHRQVHHQGNPMLQQGLLGNHSSPSTFPKDLYNRQAAGYSDAAYQNPFWAAKSPILVI